MSPIHLIFKPYDSANENENLWLDTFDAELNSKESLTEQVWCYEFSRIPRTIIYPDMVSPFRAAYVDFTVSIRKGLAIKAYVYGPLDLNKVRNVEYPLGGTYFMFNGSCFDNCPPEINDIMCHELRNLPQHSGRLVNYILRHT